LLELASAIFASLHVACEVEAEQRSVKIKGRRILRGWFKMQQPSLAVIGTGRERAGRLI